MSDYEKALLAQAGPYVLAARAKEIFTQEVIKGCESVIWPQPVVMEPYYAPLISTGDVHNQPVISYDNRSWQDTIRLKVWISPREDFNWNRCEQFLKQLTVASNRMGLEIIGNQDRIYINFLCSKPDRNIIDASLAGKLGHSKLSLLCEDPFDGFDVRDWSKVKFYDYYPPAPYFYLLTQPDELKQSPYDSLIRVLSKLPSRGLGIFQILFEPVTAEHNWHRNIEMLTDLEYMAKQINNMGIIQRYAQQTPSGDIHNMSGKLETKAHNDKHFFAAAFRIGVLGTEHNEEYLKSLSVLSGLFQYGGRPLNYVTDLEYKNSLSVYQIEKMFQYGLTHRTGFLLNTSELVGLAHIPPIEIFDDLEIEFDKVEPLASERVVFKEGTPIGHSTIADRQLPVAIPLRNRLRHTHIIGKPDMGKSLLLEHQILDDIKKGYGIALLDPHGDLAEELLDHIPEEFIDKVIYFDPGNPDYIPIWNPIQPVVGQDLSRTVDDMIEILKSFVTGWGDRMEHILRQALFALMHISGASLLDVFEILQHGSKASKETRELVLQAVRNEVVRQFWQQDILSYKPSDLGPAKHKLSKFLLGGPVSLMLSQPHSLINFQNIMNNNMIFIANLSNIGSGIRNILGGFQLSIMHMVALTRNQIPKSQRKAFFIYLDEAHRFVTDSLEDTITETRKYKVGLTFSHQNLEQLNAPKIGALSSVGTKIAFNVEGKEAAFLSKGLKSIIKPEDFYDLDLGDAIVRIGNKITKIKTYGPLEMPKKSFKNEIIEHSINKYYRPVEQVHKMIAERHQRGMHPFTPLAADFKRDNGIKPKRDYERFIEK